MIELAQHIETLLLENDCVIVPGFGGFVAATRLQPALRKKIYFYLLPAQSALILN